MHLYYNNPTYMYNHVLPIPPPLPPHTSADGPQLPVALPGAQLRRQAGEALPGGVEGQLPVAPGQRHEALVVQVPRPQGEPRNAGPGRQSLQVK